MSERSKKDATATESRRSFLRAGLLLSGGLLVVKAGTGCAEGTRLIAQRPEVFLPGGARVVLMKVDDDLITLDVFNQTPYPLTIYRDAFLLSTPSGMRSRLPGGVSNVYNVAPGGVHTVKMRYKLDGLHRGDQVALMFQNALVVNGQPMPLEPLPFVVE